MKKITKAGYEKLKEELDFLKKVKRKDIAQRLNIAASHGDLSENAAYQEAKEDQTNTENRILDIERSLRDATIIKEIKTETVSVGSTLTVIGPDGQEEIKIVGSEEADPLKGWISFSSPLGRALMGQKKGSKITFEVFDGQVEYQIVDLT